MKDRTLLLSALVALVIHGVLLFSNFGMTEPSLASAESTIEVTLVGPAELPAAEAEPSAEPVSPSGPETKPETVEEPLPEPEPVVETPIEPEVMPEPIPEPEPVEIVESPAEPATNEIIEKTEYVVEPAESAQVTESTASVSSEGSADKDTTILERGGAAAAPVDFPPSYMNNPKPSYPREARRLGQEGRILLLVEVLASGRVGRVEIETSSGYDILDDAAVSAVRKWRFAPAKKGTKPVAAWVKVPVEFDLRSGE